MENEEYGIKLRLLTSGFKSALRRTARETKTYGEEMEKSTTISPKAGIALLGVVGALALMAKATNKYIQSDKQLQGEMKLTSQVIGNMVSALGNALSPAIKGVINVAEYAIIVLAKLIQLFTGFNALENINNDNLDDTTKKAKAASKALAGFDTLTTLTSSSGGSGAKDIGISTDAMKAFQEKVEQVDKIFEKYGTHIKTATELLLGFVGVSMLTKLAKFIGVAGAGGAAGTGLAGIAGLLGWIAALGALTIEIALIIKGIDKWNKFKKDMEEYGDLFTTNNENQSTFSKNAVDQLTKLQKKEKKTEDEERQMAVIKQNLLNKTKNLNYQYKDQIGVLRDTELATTVWSKATKEQIKGLQSLIKTNAEYASEVEEVTKANGYSNEELSKYIDNIQENINMAKKARSEIASDVLIWDWKEVELADKYIKDLTDSLSNIKSQYAIKLLIDADTGQVNKKTAEWLTKTANNIASLFSAVLGKNNPASNAITGLIKKFSKFDVGTNYVPQDMAAIVHKGEMIVPKKYNPATSNINGGNEETNMLLRQLNETLEQKQFNGYISAKDITDTAINGINQQSRIMGRSVIR